ncbi:hemicentin-1-like [Hoplias malabaricus]|uniref:hemicentin-1-like n=1 Tax=Hoplias malabaricus TaxID=27720 RepID=UPI003463622C
MGCTYTYPSNQTAFWTKGWSVNGEEPPDLLNDPEYRDRVQFTGDKQHNCTLRLRDVTEKDQRKYYFRFITDQTGGKYQGEDGVDLSVTVLQVEVPETVTEGDRVTLTCKTSCSLTDSPTFTWYKNGHGLSSRTDQLHLQSVSREDKGRYHCAVQGLNSPEVTLNVRYGPKNVSVSICPSGETVKDSSVTLTCSSDANPPVQNYTWFKEGTSFLSKGENYTMNRIRSVDSGEYKCNCSNEHGEKHSEDLTLNVLYGPKNVSVSIRPSGETVEDSSVTLTCSSDANPPVQNYTWFKKLDKGPQLKSTQQNYSISNISSADSGEYRCMANNTQGSQLSEYKTLTVLYGPKSVSVSVRPSGETVEDSSVTLTCSSDANPPPECNWFKGTSFLSKGENYTMNRIRSVDSGEYKCNCSNEHGEKYSEALTLNVLYPPKSVSVSIRPSGETVEDSSVTLTCSSDANPPPECNWFKGTSLLSKGENYTMNRIRSVDSGEYKCNCSNEHGVKYSEPLTLNVVYPSKSVSVSIRPSGETVEDSSVTLTCSSDANPPVQNYTWFKEGETSPVGSGHSYSALQSGSYYCVAQNEYGAQIAAAVTLNVRYGPKNILVSIHPSGEIVEDSSVTLTCSSDANPPPEYNWFKGTSLAAKGEIYTMNKTSSVNSGEYRCKCSNEHGEKYSEALTLNVLYPPKSVSVSIRPSGETVEDSSVTLTCSSDANPPPECNWFKGTSFLSKGENYTMNRIRSVDSGEYKCNCSNEHGEKHSEALTLNVLYPPKSVSVSIRPSGETVEESSVTLTCSSDANPPPECNWFKGTSFLSKGENYTMNRIRSVDNGEYKCNCSNEHGEKHSEALTLNVLYPPKSVSMSIRPSGETVEDSSVTLTCSSDANPPPECNWFKGTSFLSKGENYTMNRIRSVDNGEYKCNCSNEHGEKHSEALTLNVLYPPKSVSVSIRPSGETVEDSSVTLTCGSDANPPPECNWFKGTTYLSKGEIYTMNKTSSVDSGEYKCKCSNEHGEKYSEVLTLNVLYPPTSVSVSITFSGETVEDSSVTLTCSSDANPPVQNYTWFIEGETSPVGSGHSYSFTKNSRSSGWYYCFTQNELGSKKSAAVPVNIEVLQVEVPETVTEGDKVTLTCKTSCSLPDSPTFTWYENGHGLSSRTDQLHLQSVSREDKGRYHCAVKGLNSPEVTLNNILVSIRPSGETVEDSSVTLTCSSDANPPVQNYTWFKEGETSPVGSGHSYSALQSGSYYCVSQNEYGAQTAAAVSVGVKDPSTGDDVHYASVVHLRDINPKNDGSSSSKASVLGIDEDAQYATVQRRFTKMEEKTEEGVQYVSVRFIRNDASSRSSASALEDLTVIYSSVK